MVSIELRQAIATATNDEMALRADSDYLFVLLMERFSPQSADFLKIMQYAPELYKLNPEKTTELLTSAYISAADILGETSSGKLAWQTKTLNNDLSNLRSFVYQNVVWALSECQTNEMVKSLFYLLSFDGEDFKVKSPKGDVSLRYALNLYVSHAKILAWLLQKGQWQRWPEFLFQRIKLQSLSRTKLAQDLGIKGWWAKRRVVRKLEKDIAKKKDKRFKDPVV